MTEIEVPFACPYCFAPISMLVDPSVPAQRYVEDCEVCCHPIQVSYRVEDEALVAFEAEVMEG
ncbi:MULTISPECIES: CPXCG motif-containing cysteine-rich protein [unclassified Rubrivirga]|uniref:CPXCG motif-containing cysteine-rich protein n=1 Tax=unclassified Rubrivirga TaxID=2640460 RepID=UPI00398F8FAE